jgi:hypothetical protein
MNLVSCQLSLPLIAIQRLGKEQQCKLLLQQCKRIAMSEWESMALVDICRKKSWMSKGVAIVHKYAGCIDEIQDCLSRINRGIDRLHCLHQQACSAHSLEENVLLEECLTLCVVFIRLLLSLCRWRKLQWTPRPVSVEEQACRLSLSEYVVLKLNRIAALLMLLSELHLKSLRKIPVELLTLLLSPVQMYEGIGELHCRLATGGISLSSTLQLQNSNSSGSSGNGGSGALLQDIAKAVADVFNMEDVIDEKWPVNVNTNDNAAINGSSEAVTCLCIPYPTMKQSSMQNRWFLSTFLGYDKNIRTLHSLTSLLLESFPRVKASDFLADGLLSALNEQHCAASWAARSPHFDASTSSSCLASSSSSSLVVVQSLVPLCFLSNISSSSSSESVETISAASVLNHFANDSRPSFSQQNSSLLQALTTPLRSLSRESALQVNFLFPLSYLLLFFFSFLLNFYKVRFCYYCFLLS